MNSRNPLYRNGFACFPFYGFSLFFVFVLYNKGQIKDKKSAGFSNTPLQYRRHSFASPGLCLLECVGVDIQRRGGLRVAQGRAHRPGICAAAPGMRTSFGR